MDDVLATHFAHLFIRDPIVIFSEDLQELDLKSTDHFENLQSTNWQHMRFKPPPANSVHEIGWRVEFRSMEIQMTDFENAAFAVFIVLITRAILSFDLNFYIPIPRATENMETAHRRDAVLNDKFYFRKDPFPARTLGRSSRAPSRATSRAASRATSPSGTTPHHNHNNHNHHSLLHHHQPNNLPPFGPVEDEYEPMTINEIINGPAASDSSSSSSTSSSFPGLLPLVESYLDSVNVDVETRCHLARYLDLIRRRADGRCWTGARWIREFVKGHAEYEGNSVVGSGIVYDLCKGLVGMDDRSGFGKEMR